MSPFYPPRMKEMRDSIVRMPIPLTAKRPALTRPKDKNKFKPQPVKPKKVEMKVKEMTKPIQLSPKDMISAYLLFFIIHGAQVGSVYRDFNGLFI